MTSKNTKASVRRILTLTVALPLLAGSLMSCMMTRDEVNEETERKAVAQQVNSLQKDHADQRMRTTELNEELRSIGGRLEALENRASVASKDREKMASANESQMAEANKKIAALQEEVQKLQNQVALLGQEIIRLDSKPVAKAPVAAAVAEKAGAGADKNKVNHFANGDEAFKQKDFKQAIVEYQKYRDTLPNGKKFPAATYRIGVAFKELGMKEEAKTFFEEVQSKFPDSNFAKMAKDQLKSK
jgi:TolA-binding protein